MLIDLWQNDEMIWWKRSFDFLALELISSWDVISSVKPNITNERTWFQPNCFLHILERVEKSGSEIYRTVDWMTVFNWIAIMILRHKTNGLLFGDYSKKVFHQLGRKILNTDSLYEWFKAACFKTLFRAFWPLQLLIEICEREL